MIVAGWQKNADYHEKQLHYMTGQADKTVFDAMTPLAYGKLARDANREAGTYSIEEWRRVSMGYSPFEVDWMKKPLTKTAMRLGMDNKPLPAKEQNDDRRDCLELILSTDKSHAVWLAAQSVEVQNIAMEVKNKVLREKIYPLLQSFALVKMDSGSVQRADEFGFISHFNHIENRGVEPFDHTHIVIKNSAFFKGQSYALESQEIFNNTALIDAVYQMELMHALNEKFGLAFVPHHTKPDKHNEHIDQKQKNIFTWAIDGVPQHIASHYSSRSKEIHAAAKKAGGSSAEALAIAQVSTREQKTDLSAAELRVKWKAEIAEMGFTDELAKTLCTQQKAPAALQSDVELIDSLHRRLGETLFTESQFKAGMIKNLMFSMSPDEALKKSAELFEKHCVAFLDAQDKNLYDELVKETHPDRYQALQTKLSMKIKYSSRKWHEMDLKTDAVMKAGRDSTYHKLDVGVVSKHLTEFQKRKGFAFSTDQLLGVLALTTEKGNIATLIGGAGTGKTTVIEAVKEVCEMHDMRMIGTSTGAKATKGLANDSGIKICYNTSELLTRMDSGDFEFTKNDVLVWDEAGMSSTEEVFKITQAIGRVGAKLILVGDARQLAAVGSQAIFRHLSTNYVNAELTTINRQKNIDEGKQSMEREMVKDFAAGRSFDGIMKLHEQGGVVVTETTEERIRLIADDYLLDKKSEKEKYIIASMNSDADAINLEVQKRLLDNGTLSIAGRSTVLDEEGIERHFHLGERIVFMKGTKSDDQSKVKASNSETGKLVNAYYRSGKLTGMEIELDNGKRLRLGKDKMKNLRLGSCITTHKSQGATTFNSYVFASTSMNSLHNAYVQMSRHKNSTKLYLSRDMVEQLANAVGVKEPTPQAKGYASDLITKDLLNGSIDEATAKAKREQINTFMGCRKYLNSHPSSHILHATVPKAKFMQIQVLNDFVELVDQMGKLNYKKTTFDMEYLTPVQKDIITKLEPLAAEVIAMRRAEQLKAEPTIAPKPTATPVQKVEPVPAVVKTPEQKKKPTMGMSQ